MGLKEKIQEEYRMYYNLMETTLSKNVSKKRFFTNWSKVSRKITTLKKDLCLFADKFDKYLDYMYKNKSEDLPEGMYDCIKKSFVGKIAEIDKNFFIYVAKKGEQWRDIKTKDRYSRNIKKFEDIFVNFMCKFQKSKKLTGLRDLIKLFTRMKNNFDDDLNKFKKLILHISTIYHCIAFEYYNDICIYLNLNTILFINYIIDFMLKELYDKKMLINLTRKCIIGSDEKYFHDKNGKGFKYGHTIKPVPEGVKIFPTGKPLPYEVMQANIGNCYLMAVLISLAKTNPKAITDCFTQGLDKIEKEDDIEIRFFYKVGNGDDFTKDSLKIIINKKNVINRSGIKNEALWPKLIEKAYAIYRSEGYDSTSSLLEKLGGGFSYTVMFAITGEKIDRIKSKFAEFEITDRENRRMIIRKPGFVETGSEGPGLMEPKYKNVINIIIEKLKEKKAVVCYFKKKFNIIDKKSKEKIKIITGHEYAIVGVNDEKGYIRLVNPWKSDGRTKTDKPSGLREGGHIAMSYEDFNEYCKGIYTPMDSTLI